jgi:hypothetical protein
MFMDSVTKGCVSMIPCRERSEGAPGAKAAKKRYRGVSEGLLLESFLRASKRNLDSGPLRDSFALCCQGSVLTKGICYKFKMLPA